MLRLKQKPLVPILLVLFGVLFVLIGFFRGEVATVLQKAVQICLECIGIG